MFRCACSASGTFGIAADVADRTAALMLNNTAALGAGAAVLFGGLGVNVVTVGYHVGLDGLGYRIGADGAASTTPTIPNRFAATIAETITAAGWICSASPIKRAATRLSRVWKKDCIARSRC